MAIPENAIVVDESITTGRGFFAALDQSGGSTPKALLLYGLDGTAYANEAEMYDRIRQLEAKHGSGER